jgi:hypothetical protein
MPSPAFIFDFDSTLVSVESPDELLEMSVCRIGIRVQRAVLFQ